MWFSRLAILVTVASTGLSYAQVAGCPAYERNSPLVQVTVFDGPPNEMASLVPDVSKGSDHHTYASWDIGYIFDAGRILYLECSYLHSTKPITVKVDKKVKECVYRTHALPKPAELTCR